MMVSALHRDDDLSKECRPHRLKRLSRIASDTQHGEEEDSDDNTVPEAVPAMVQPRGLPGGYAESPADATLQLLASIPEFVAHAKSCPSDSRERFLWMLGEVFCYMWGEAQEIDDAILDDITKLRGFETFGTLDSPKGYLENLVGAICEQYQLDRENNTMTTEESTDGTMDVLYCTFLILGRTWFTGCDCDPALMELPAIFLQMTDWGDYNNLSDLMGSHRAHSVFEKGHHVDGCHGKGHSYFLPDEEMTNQYIMFSAERQTGCTYVKKKAIFPESISVEMVPDAVRTYIAKHHTELSQISPKKKEVAAQLRRRLQEEGYERRSVDLALIAVVHTNHTVRFVGGSHVAGKNDLHAMALYRVVGYQEEEDE